MASSCRSRTRRSRPYRTPHSAGGSWSVRPHPPRTQDTAVPSSSRAAPSAARPAGSLRSGDMPGSALQSIHPSVWIAPGAQLYGHIAIGEGSSVWTNVTMRAECFEIRIGRMTNVQDFVMIHVPWDGPTVIGDFCSIAHHATVHGCTIEDECLIGVNATI